MRRTLTIATQMIALIGASIPCVFAAAQQQGAPPSLLEQLQAQYKVAKTAFSSGQVTVTEPGTVLVIQKGGILGCAPGNLTLAPATFKDGSLNPPGKMAAVMCGKNARQLATGEKVYATKIDVNLKKDRVSFRIMECDACNGTAQPSSYKSDVFFDFPKGSLATTSVPDVEDTIAKVFAIDAGKAETPAAQPAGQPEQPAAAQQAPAQAPPAEVKLGQTIDQVVAALGQPEKIVDLGTKKIYVYKDLKITFTNGKVSDVQ